MKVVVVARCLNEERNIERFIHGYSFADLIIVSDGGSIDNSLKLLRQYKNVKIIHFDEKMYYGDKGEHYNPDGSHLNFVINAGKEYEPTWEILDDIDDVPNSALKFQARNLLEAVEYSQINAFRLYLWNDDQYFPKMNNNFHPDYTSLWAWKPNELNIWADGSTSHVTIRGLHPEPYKIEIPMCLLHKSWDGKTIEKKLERYGAMGIKTSHPFNFAGNPVDLPEWAHE